jgi:hypothetical protein
MPTPPLPMYLIWHLRNQHDEAQRWLRAQLETVAWGVHAPVQHKLHSTE